MKPELRPLFFDFSSKIFLPLYDGISPRLPDVFGSESLKIRPHPPIRFVAGERATGQSCA
jgi:hypothetical protein